MGHGVGRGGTVVAQRYGRPPSPATLRRRGETVFTYEWDHGTPLVGAHVDVVYEYRGAYYAVFSYDERLVGPLESLDEALGEGFLGVNAATQAIWSSGISRPALIRRLHIYPDGAGRVINVNGKPWRVPHRLTLASVRAEVARWRAESLRVSERTATSVTTLIISRMAAGDAHHLERALSRMEHRATWESTLRELGQLRLSSRGLEMERQRLLNDVSRSARRRLRTRQ